MFDGGMAGLLSQFGAAGLIGVLWILERRLSMRREQQLDEAHQKMVAQQQQLDAVLAVVKDNTRAINTLEQSQRRLIDLLNRPAEPGGPRSCS